MKNIVKIIKYILFIILIFVLVPYIICPVYKFPRFMTFKGDSIFNPYSGNEKYNWYKVNLHAHSNAWYGITSGNSIADSVYSKYNYFHFDVIGISNYMKINKFLSSKDFYIPVYEHGYGVSKVHQLSVGAKKVVWLDFMFFFNTNQKQFIINLLKTNSDIVSLNHPRYKNAYTVSDLKKLSNYDCFEALNRSWFSIYLWDSLLSAGHYVPLIANDDCHDVSNVFDIATNFTLVRAKSSQRKDIINSLKQGSSVGVDIYMNNNETFSSKLIKVNSLPNIEKLKTNNNSITIILGTLAKEFKFIGQNGKIKKLVINSDSASYNFASNDTYIRTEITTFQGSRLFLNPVYKYQDHILKLNCEIGYVKTFIHKIILFIIICIFIVRYFRKKLFNRY